MTAARTRAARGRHVADRNRNLLPAPASAVAAAGAIAVAFTPSAQAATLATTPAGVPQQVSPRVAAPAGLPTVTTRLAVPSGLGVPEAPAAYRPQVSCDPVAKPGVLAFRALVLSTYKVGSDAGIIRNCDAGGSSEHMEGRAWDWHLSAGDPTQRAAADSFLDWLMAKGPDGTWGWQARRLGIMYVIWNGRIWAAYDAEEGWRPYYGPSQHTDHVHFSFSWDGAMKRTSWWTGRPVTTPDLGPCRANAGQDAARWTAPSTTCPPLLPSPVALSPAARSKPHLGYGSRGATVAALQRTLGVSPTGTFAGLTEAALKGWQTRHGLYPSGAADPATWTVLLATAPAPAPSPSPSTPSLSALGYGARNADVRSLQTRLVSLGWLASGQATGVYDAATRAAVAAFQRAQGWTGGGADGLMGPTTLSRLFSPTATGAPAPAPRPAPSPAPPPAPRPVPAPGTTRPSLSALGYGARNADVRSLQARLVSLGWLASGRTTGVYDAATRAAVAAFQRAQLWTGSGADGLMGPTTLSRLWSATATEAPTAKPQPSSPPAPSPHPAPGPAPRPVPTGVKPSLSALGYGARNADVRSLQARLVSLGWLAAGQPTGVYDAATRGAVAAFQRAQHWTGSGADGLMGPTTLSRLWSATATKAPAAAARRPSLGSLRYGAASSDVRLLQQRLVALHRLAAAQVTGRYDAATRAAVAAFQRAQGWRGGGADGLMGPATLARLFG